MSTDLITQLFTLIDRWDNLVILCKVLENFEEDAPPEQTAYLAAAAFGMETAREELSAVLAKALTDSMKLSPTLM
ncbi:MAG: hypothetical protein H0X30_21995 [Anaerolineae bacterium]|nr:hypothetical protein [Anaerolineae bacterium]